MRRRRYRPTGGLIAFAVLVVTSLVLFTFFVRGDGTGPLHTVQLGAAEVLRPVQGFVGTVSQPVSGAADRVGAAFERGEEEELRRELREYREQAASAASLSEENERLRSLLESQESGYEYSPVANVVSPVGERFTDRIVIDLGADDGVEPDQPVVVGDNTLVGRITDTVTANTAEVMMITDRNFAAGTQIVPPQSPEDADEETTGAAEETTVAAEETTAAVEGESPEGSESPAGGLFRPNLEGNLEVEYVEADAEVEEGDFVVTSGRAGELELLFPAGLLVGTVASVDSQDMDQYKRVAVEPAEPEPGDVQEVQVIVGW